MPRPPDDPGSASWPDLDRLFTPRGIAVLGASPHREKVGGRPLAYLEELGYKGKVFPVNPTYGRIGRHRCFANVTQIPDDVGGDELDLALIALSASKTPEALRECGLRGIRFAIVFGAGFAETDDKGARLQQELLDAAREAGVRIIGPNSLGVVGVHSRTIGTFATSLEDLGFLTEGSFSFVTQSGALGAFMFRAAQEQGIGLRHFVSTGNESDLSFADYIAHFAQDPGTKVIGGYLEGVDDGPRLMAALDLARYAGKHVCLLKVGRSELGREAALSHTNSLTGSDRLYEAAFSQTGVVRVGDLQEMLDAVTLLTAPNSPRAGGGVAIASVSGGLGVWMADAFGDSGVRLAQLDGIAAERLREALPTFARIGNPVDFTGQIVNQPQVLRDCLRVMVENDDVGVLLIGLGLQHWNGDRLARDIIATVQDRKLLTVVAWMVGPSEPQALLRDAGIPVFDDFARAVRAVTHIMRSTLSSQIAPPTPIRPPFARPNASEPSVSKVLAESEAKLLLSGWGLEIPKSRTVGASARAAVEAGRHIGYPLVLKGQGESLLHKSERGLVQVGLRNERELASSAERMLQPTGVLGKEPPCELLVEEMIPPSVEVIVGITWDEVFGLTTMVGVGGTQTELFDDVAHHIGAVSHADVRGLIAQTQLSRMLQGYRGGSVADVEALVQAVVVLNQAVFASGGSVREVEINPILVRPRGQGAVIADAVVRLLAPPPNDDKAVPICVST